VISLSFGQINSIRLLGLGITSSSSILIEVFPYLLMNESLDRPWISRSQIRNVLKNHILSSEMTTEIFWKSQKTLWTRSHPNDDDPCHFRCLFPDPPSPSPQSILSAF
jgi:hypothetical protein